LEILFKKQKMENIYNKMKGLLGMTEELSEETSMMAEAFLVDGTTIKTDSDRFEEGSMVFVVGEDDERMALPSGTYELQDGAVIEVVDGSAILSSSSPTTNTIDPSSNLSESVFIVVPSTRNASAIMLVSSDSSSVIPRRPFILL
jgi:hypothetical protein